MNDPILSSSRDEYARRMTRVLNYIEQHLDEPLELAQLADVAMRCDLCIPVRPL
ncbi:hypothetical protein ACFFTM_01895 [Pseudoduganella plicata]|uniref:AraC family transcriptional regulator n=1 Tax=Pseudoduganella plicata TaxID=321984 RepID=A0AA88C9S4_9BURK|nr:hypothetical protein [Pseudoduganella plicata]GGY72935.1 hypothetical protein GCM10007388_01220 [Pseudoduganella plicata]